MIYDEDDLVDLLEDSRDCYDIDLHRYMENGEVRYYSFSARLHYQCGIKSIWVDGDPPVDPTHRFVDGVCIDCEKKQ